MINKQYNYQETLNEAGKAHNDNHTPKSLSRPRSPQKPQLHTYPSRAPQNASWSLTECPS